MIDAASVMADAQSFERIRGLVVAVARRLASSLPPNQVDLDDLVSEGWVAIVRALPDYDPSIATLSTFVSQRLRGAMIDYVRSLDVLPRAHRSLVGKVDRARWMLAHDFGRDPTLEEIARFIDEPLSSVHSAQAAAAAGAPPASIDETRGDWPLEAVLPDPAESTPDRAFVEKERATLVRMAIARLPHQERTVVVCRYFYQMRSRDAARILGVSESRASQIHSQALATLRALLAEFVIDLDELKIA